MSEADGAARDSSTICADGVGHTMRRRAVNSYDNVDRCALTTALARAAVAAAACGRSPSCTVEGRMHHEAAPCGAELGVRVLFSPEKIPPTPYPRARHASCRRSPKNAAVLVALRPREAAAPHVPLLRDLECARAPARRACCSVARTRARSVVLRRAGRPSRPARALHARRDRREPGTSRHCTTRTTERRVRLCGSGRRARREVEYAATARATAHGAGARKGVIARADGRRRRVFGLLGKGCKHVREGLLYCKGGVNKD